MPVTIICDVLVYSGHPVRQDIFAICCIPADDISASFDNLRKSLSHKCALLQSRPRARRIRCRSSHFSKSSQVCRTAIAAACSLSKCKHAFAPLPNYPKAMKLLHDVQVVWRPCWQAKLSNDGKNTEGQLRECFVIPLNRLSKHSFSGKLGGSIIGRFTIRWSRPSNYLCTGEMTTTLFSISASHVGQTAEASCVPIKKHFVLGDLRKICGDAATF